MNTNLVDISWDYIKKLYIKCDNENLDPIWFKCLHLFVETYNNSNDKISKRDLMLALKRIQCKSEKSKEIFENKENYYFYDYEYKKSLENKFYPTKNSHNELMFYNALVKDISKALDFYYSTNVLPYNLFEEAKLLDILNSNHIHTKEILKSILFTPRNNKNLLEYGVSKEVLQEFVNHCSGINDLGKLIDDICNLFEEKFTKTLHINNGQKTDVVQYNSETSKRVIESERFKGWGTRESFIYSIESGFGKYSLSLDVKQLSISHLAGNKQLSNLLKRICSNTDSVDAAVAVYMDKNPEKKETLKKLILKGYGNYWQQKKEYIEESYDNDKIKKDALKRLKMRYDNILELTDEEIELILTLPINILDNASKVNQEIENYNEDQKFVELMETTKLGEYIKKLETEAGEGKNINAYLKRKIRKYIYDNKDNADTTEIINKLENIAQISKYDHHKDYLKVIHILTDEEIDFILSLDQETLNSLQRFKSKYNEIYRRRETIQKENEDRRTKTEWRILREEEKLKNERLKQEAKMLRQEENNVSSEGEKHYLLISQEIDDLTQILLDKEKSGYDVIYQFNPLDMFLIKHHKIETLIKILERRLDEFQTGKFKRWQLTKTLEFLNKCSKYSNRYPIKNYTEYIVGDKVIKPTEEQVAAVKQYLFSNHIPVNEDTFNLAMRRLIRGGDIESKYGNKTLEEIASPLEVLNKV